MEFVEGINIDDKQKLQAAGIDLKLVSDVLANCFARQMFEFGVIQFNPSSFTQTRTGATFSLVGVHTGQEARS